VHGFLQLTVYEPCEIRQNKQRRRRLQIPAKLNADFATPTSDLIIENTETKGAEMAPFDVSYWDVSTVFECQPFVVVGGKPEVETEPKWANDPNRTFTLLLLKLRYGVSSILNMIGLAVSRPSSEVVRLSRTA
jgi:hypothetical protein